MTTTRTTDRDQRDELYAAWSQARDEQHRLALLLDEWDRDHPRRYEWAPRIRKARAASNMSQTMVARIAGLSPSTVSHAERGDRDITALTAMRLADALGVSVQHLIIGED